MKKSLHFLLFAFVFISSHLFAQTYQLNGNPVVTTGWTLTNDAIVNTDFIQLTPDQTSKVGSIKLNDPINLKYCDKWKVEFDFRIDGNGTTTYGRGDGFSFWYLQNPPANFVGGSGLGIPNGAIGLMAGFDIFNNSTEGQMSKVHLLYGVSTGNIEYNNTAGSSFHTPDLQTSSPFVGATYKHVEVNGQVDPATPTNWIIQVKIDNVIVINQSFAPAGAAAAMTTGYFGFAGSTGGASARNSIKNVKVYIDKVPLLQTSITPNAPCPDITTGIATVDLTSFNTQLSATPGSYNFSYYVLGSATPIANPTNYQYNGNADISVLITDPTNTLCDNPDAVIHLVPGTIPKNDAILIACKNNGQGIFNLTTANVTTITTATKKYYPTLANLLAGTNEITNPAAYSSAGGDVYVKITSQNCSAVAKITLNFYPSPIVNDATITSCFLPTNQSSGTFDLTAVNVTTQAPVTKKYYATLTDAMNETNELFNFVAYTSTNGFAYIKVFNANGCASIAKVTLIVTPPTKSSVLVDKTICVENRTTLDAGTGFTSYTWSTGATTQSIQNVAVGSYWVDLETNGCITRQTVHVNKAPEIIFSEIIIKNNTVTLNVAGGKPSYQYSLDGITWQNSNVFTNLPRGQNTFYVKDFYDCTPNKIEITVPNLVNAITPNGDNTNDVLDYSALSYKKNLKLEIFDRYGNKISVLDRNSGYKWNGTLQGKKLPTATYWYTIKWNEPNQESTPVQYSGWILLKNRN